MRDKQPASSLSSAPLSQREAAEPSSPANLDFEACLEYVRQVGAAMRASAARVRAREAMAEELAKNAQEQISRAEETLRSSEDRVRDAAFKIHEAETRAERAEKRASEAEAWLNRLFDTMQQELQGVQSGGPDDPLGAARSR